MKRSLIPLLAAAAMLLAAIAWLAYDRAATLQQQVALLNAEREDARKAQAELAAFKAAAEAAQENVSRLTAERDAALARAKALPPGGPLPAPPGTQPPADEKGGNAMMQGIAKM